MHLTMGQCLVQLCPLCEEAIDDTFPGAWWGSEEDRISVYYGLGYCPACGTEIRPNPELEKKIVKFYKLQGGLMLKPPRSKKAFVYMEREGKNNVQMWQGWVDGDQVISQWGTKDGKIQQTIDIPGSKGREDTKAFITPEQSALDQLVRDVKKKAQKGYEIVKGPSAGPFANALTKELGEVTRADSIDFSGPLPNNVAFSKPQNSVEPQKLMKLAAREQKGIGGPPLAWLVKKNGMCYLVSKDSRGRVWIQSRGKLIVENDKFPHLVEQFGDFMPKKTLLLCEFYAGEGNTKNDFTAMQKISNSLAPRALEMQKELGLVHAYVFRVPFWKGTNMEANKPCTTWLEFLNDLIDGWDDDKDRNGMEQPGLAQFEYIHGPAMSDDSYEEALEEMEQFGYEGWVVYDCWNSLGKKHVSFLGQPDRPNVCWKVKRALEDDFIGIWDPTGEGAHCTSKCRIPDRKAAEDQSGSERCCVCGKRLKPNGTWGTGKNKERVGTLSLYQYGEDGVKRYVCEVSSGLTDEQKQNIANEGFCTKVVQIGYQDRGFITGGDDSDALTHPKVICFREDKELNECINKEV